MGRKKRENREQGGRGKIGDKQKGGDRNEGKRKSHNSKQEEEGIHGEWKMKKKIKDESPAIFYKCFIMSGKRKIFFYQRSEVVFSP